MAEEVLAIQKEVSILTSNIISRFSNDHTGADLRVGDIRKDSPVR